MASATEAGIASFFGGIARGIGKKAQQRDQKKQAEKDARNKIITEVGASALSNPNLKTDPSEVVAWMLKEHGFRDPETQKTIDNLMNNARTVVPQFTDKGSSPGTSIGLGQPGGGQAPAATGPQASRARSVGLMEPDRAPRAPQFYSADEMEQRNVAHAQSMSDIEQKRQMALDAQKAEEAQKLAALKISRGPIMNGRDLPDGAVITTGAARRADGRYQPIRFGDGHWEYEPVEGKVDNSPEGRLAKAYADLKSDDPDVKQAAQDVIKMQQQSFVLKAIQAKTAADKLKLLEDTLPLTVQQKKNQVEGEKLLNDLRDANLDALKGNPQHVMDLATAQAAKLVTEKGGEFYGHSAKDVTDTVLHKMGFDPDDVRDRIKSSASGAAIPNPAGGAATGGGSGGGADGSPDATAQPAQPSKEAATFLKSLGPGRHEIRDKTTGQTSVWIVDAKGNITPGKS